MAVTNQLAVRDSTERELRSHVTRFWPAVIAISLAAFCGTMNNMSLNAFLPFISRDLGQSVPVVGQITTVVLLLGAAASIVIGPLADRYGMRRFLLIGVASVVLTAMGTSVASSFEMLVTARLISGFSGGILLGLSLAAARQLFAGRERRRATGIVLAGAALAPAIGIPMLTFAGSLTSWRMAFGVLAIFAFLVACVARLVLPGSTEPPGKADPFQFGSYLDAYRPLLRDRNMRALYASVFARAACWMACLTYLGAYLNAVYDAGERTIGWGFMTAGAGFFLGSLAAGDKLSGIHSRPLAVTSLGVMAGLTAITFTGVVHLVPVFGLLIAIAVFAAISNVCMTSLLGDESPAGPATTIGLSTATFGIGSAAGVAVGGLLIAAGGYAAMGLGLATLLVLSMVLIWKPRGQGSVTPHPGTSPSLTG